jgi:molecular chaperone DnaJ
VQLKDYYSILELSPSATTDEIRKAYRRLAHLYHPDKKNDDAYAAAKFSDIKEAYEVLTNLQKKDHYLQQRWYMQSTGKKFSSETVTPVSILKQMLELSRYVSKLDAHRMYHEGLFNHINTILSDENVTLINSFNDVAVNNEIVLNALKSAGPLPWRFVPSLMGRLDKIKTPDPAISKKINYWEKRKVWIMLLVVLLICLVIFLAGR